jgi:hypothetical protein
LEGGVGRDEAMGRISQSIATTQLVRIDNSETRLFKKVGFLCVITDLFEIDRLLPDLS